MKPRTVLVPTELALVYDGTGWRFGEVPPAWWLEMTEPEIADEPPPRRPGRPVSWNRVQAVRGLARRGLSDGQIAGMLGIQQRQVSRDKTRAGLTTPRGRGVPYLPTAKGLAALRGELAAPRTNCRPGSGPCRRRHEHAAVRRAI